MAKNIKKTADLPFIEKYRPQNLEDVSSHVDLINSVQRMIAKKQFPHLLFFGPAGTGKTSTALVIARLLYGSKLDHYVLQLNASDDRGIDVVRDTVKSFVSTGVLSFGHDQGVNLPKMVILDEADNMTNSAQFALRRTIEEFSDQARFVVICNYLHKIIPPIQSRCAPFRLGTLSENDVRRVVRKVCKAENILIDEGGEKALVKVGGGDMRKVLNSLQSVVMRKMTLRQKRQNESDKIQSVAQTQDLHMDKDMEIDNVIHADDVHASSGVPLQAHIDMVIDMLFTQGLRTCITKLSDLFKTYGYSLEIFIEWLFKDLSMVDIPFKARKRLIPILASIEARMKMGANEDVQLAAFASAFFIARSELEKVLLIQNLESPIELMANDENYLETQCEEEIQLMHEESISKNHC